MRDNVQNGSFQLPMLLLSPLLQSEVSIMDIFIPNSPKDDELIWEKSLTCALTIKEGCQAYREKSHSILWIKMIW